MFKTCRHGQGQTSTSSSSSDNDKIISTPRQEAKRKLLSWSNIGLKALLPLNHQISVLGKAVTSCTELPTSSTGIPAHPKDANTPRPKLTPLTLLDLPVDIIPQILICIPNPSNFSMTCKVINRTLSDSYIKAVFVKERCGGLTLEGIIKWGRLFCSKSGNEDSDNVGIKGKAPVVELLLRWGCFTHTKAGWDTLMRYFVRKGFVAFGKHCTHVSKLDLLERAALQNRLEVLKYIVEECECGVANAHANEERVLYFASRVGNLEIVKYLVEVCACDPLARRGKPLRTASRWNHAELVKYLCTKTQDPAHISEALREAATSGSSNCVSILVNEGCARADMAMKNAAKRGHLATVSTLWYAEFDPSRILEYKSTLLASESLNETNQENISSHRYQKAILEEALVTAASNGHLDIVRFLSERLGGLGCLYANLPQLNNSIHYWSIVEFLSSSKMRSSEPTSV